AMHRLSWQKAPQQGRRIVDNFTLVIDTRPDRQRPAPCHAACAAPSKIPDGPNAGTTRIAMTHMPLPRKRAGTAVALSCLLLAAPRSAQESGTWGQRCPALPVQDQPAGATDLQPAAPAPAQAVPEPASPGAAIPPAAAPASQAAAGPTDP